MTRDEFLRWEHKAITLLGMSGVGKTTLANKLPKTDWFHYSGDYRIGTRYLAEPIIDNVKRAAMQVSFLRELMCSDSIYIGSNITVHNLEPLSAFLGKVGDTASGGQGRGRGAAALRRRRRGPDTPPPRPHRSPSPTRRRARGSRSGVRRRAARPHPQP